MFVCIPDSVKLGFRCTRRFLYPSNWRIEFHLLLTSIESSQSVLWSSVSPSSSYSRDISWASQKKEWVNKVGNEFNWTWLYKLTEGNLYLDIKRIFIIYRRIKLNGSREESKVASFIVLLLFWVRLGKVRVNESPRVRAMKHRRKTTGFFPWYNLIS